MKLQLEMREIMTVHCTSLVLTRLPQELNTESIDSKYNITIAYQVSKSKQVTFRFLEDNHMQYIGDK